MDIEEILAMQAREIKKLRSDVDQLKRQETPVVSLENAFLAAQDGRIGAAETQLAQLSPTALAWAIYHAAPLLFPNLVGVWYMNESTGTLFWDASAQGRHVTRNGGMSVTQVAGGLLRAATLNGTNAYANRASESALEITGNMSIMAWNYKAVGGIQHPILAKTTGLTGSTNFAYWLLHGSSDNLNFSVCNGSTVKAIASAAPIGAYYYGAASFAAGVAGTVYVGSQDGWSTPVTDTSSIPASINPATTTDLTIGALHGGTSFGNGNIAMIALMNSVSNETLFRNYFEFTKGLFYGFN